MVYGALVGLILGANGVTFRLAIVVLLGLALLKGVADIVLRRSLFTGSPSAYVLYLERLAGSGTGGSWLAYMAQMALFGTVIGLAGFALGRLLF